MSNLTEQEFLGRFDNGERFTENELKYIICYGFEQVDEIEGDDHRWQREIRTIVQVGTRFFAFNWMRGLTECQENEYWEQPIEVKRHERQKTITVVEWEPVK